MHRRVRWENVIRVAGASLLVAVVVAWPRLAPPEPRLPGAKAAPLVQRGPGPPIAREPGDAARGREDRPRARPRGDGRRRVERRRNPRPRGRRRVAAATPTPPPPASPPQAVVTAAPTPRAVPDPAAAEFGFESG